MALTYIGAGGIFTKMGKLMLNINTYEAFQRSQADNLLSLLLETLGQFTFSQQDYDTISGYRDSIHAMLAQIDGNKQALRDFFNGIMYEIWKTLNLSSAERTTARIIDALIVDMDANSESVNANVLSAVPDFDVALSADTLASGQVNNAGAFIIKNYDKDKDGDVNEAVRTDYFTVTCSKDVQNSKVASGAETFSVAGKSTSEKLSYQYRETAWGNGAGPTITTLQGSDANVISNSDFTSFDSSAEIPTGWTLCAPASATTYVAQTSAYAYVGVTCMQLLNDGGVSAITLVYPLSSSVDGLVAERIHCVAISVAGSAFVTSGVNLLLVASGTSYQESWTVGSGLQFSANFTNFNKFFATPRELPDDVGFYIHVSGVESGTTIFIDNIALGICTQFAGLEWVALRTNDPPLINDKWRQRVDNDYGGVIQTAFSRVFPGRYLPSNNAGGETIADTLAT